MSFIQEYLFEVDEATASGPLNNLYAIKNYFFYDSNTSKYGFRKLIIPVSCIQNKEDIPPDEVVHQLMIKKVPILEHIINFESQTESWRFKLSNEERTYYEKLAANSTPVGVDSICG